MVHGVGVIGAGPGVAALHIPTLARLGGQLAVVHVSDSGSGRAAALAETLGARASTGIADLLEDPAVEVVAICSPPAQHAEHILASVAAGARAVFCEKPIALTVEDAEAVIAACSAAGTVLVVGTNHLFDAAWGRAKHQLDALRSPIQTVTVTLALPPWPVPRARHRVRDGAERRAPGAGLVQSAGRCGNRAATRPGSRRARPARAEGYRSADR